MRENGVLTDTPRMLEGSRASSQSPPKPHFFFPHLPTSPPPAQPWNNPPTPQISPTQPVFQASHPAPLLLPSLPLPQSSITPPPSSNLQSLLINHNPPPPAHQSSTSPPTPPLSPRRGGYPHVFPPPINHHQSHPPPPPFSLAGHGQSLPSIRPTPRFHSLLPKSAITIQHSPILPPKKAHRCTAPLLRWNIRGCLPE